MKTLWMLMTLYDGKVVIPAAQVETGAHHGGRYVRNLHG